MAKNGLEEQGQDILEEVELSFFKLSPQTIVPFEEAELSWKVTEPADKLFSVELNGVRVSKTGKAVVHPLGTTTYKIEAVAFTARKPLGKVTLVVNREDCFSDGISQNAIEEIVKRKLPDFIQQGTSIKLKEEPVSVRLDAGFMVIGIFLEYIINNFFNADVDLALKFTLGLTPSGDVRVRLVKVDADVKFVFAAYIVAGIINPLAAGALGLVQAVAQAVVAAMVEALLGPQLEKELAANLQEAIELDCARPVGEDSRITSVRAIEGVIEFECCPVSGTASFSDVLQSSSILT